MLNEFEREVLRELRKITHLLRHDTFTARIYHCLWAGQESEMAIGTLTPGSTGTFLVELLENGAPYTGTATTEWTWAASDSDVTVEPSADTTSAVFTVPASTTDTSLTVTASATAPDGTTALAPTLTVTIAASAQPTVFTATITQTA